MKKIIIVGTALCGISAHAFAAQNCCGNVCPIVIGGNVNYDSSCTTASICNCRGTTETALTGGLIEIKTKQKSTKCIGNTAYAECLSKTSYKCAVGYYGTPTIGNQKCTRCPSSGGIVGTTAASGSTAITDCYLPSGSSDSDSTGSFTYTTNCYYRL